MIVMINLDRVIPVPELCSIECRLFITEAYILNLGNGDGLELESSDNVGEHPDSPPPSVPGYMHVRQFRKTDNNLHHHT